MTHTKNTCDAEQHSCVKWIKKLQTFSAKLDYSITSGSLGERGMMQEQESIAEWFHVRECFYESTERQKWFFILLLHLENIAIKRTENSVYFYYDNFNYVCYRPHHITSKTFACSFLLSSYGNTASSKPFLTGLKMHLPRSSGLI